MKLAWPGLAVLWAASIRFREHRRHDRSQTGQVVSTNIPNGRLVHSQIIMRQQIAESANGSPGNIWIFRFELLWQPLGGLGKRLQIAKDGVLRLGV